MRLGEAAVRAVEGAVEGAPEAGAVEEGAVEGAPPLGIAARAQRSLVFPPAEATETASSEQSYMGTDSCANTRTQSLSSKQIAHPCN